MARLITNQRLVGLFFAIISGLYIYYTSDIPLDFWSESEPFNARTMPYLYGYTGVVLSALLIIAPSPEFNWAELKQLRVLPAAGLLALIIAYSASIEFFGFIVSTFALLIAGFAILGERRFVPMILVALGLSLGFYFGLDLLDIYLSPGELWS